MECDFAKVMVDLSTLGEPFGYGFMAGAGSVLTALPVRLLISLLSDR